MNFSLIQGEVEDIESKWAMLKASIVEADTRSFGQKVIGACRGGWPKNPLVDTSGEGGCQTEDRGLLTGSRGLLNKQTGTRRPEGL